MKAYEMKIKDFVRRTERKNRMMIKMINNLLPASLSELQECIAINNMLDNDY